MTHNSDTNATNDEDMRIVALGIQLRCTHEEVASWKTLYGELSHENAVLRHRVRELEDPSLTHDERVVINLFRRYRGAPPLPGSHPNELPAATEPKTIAATACNTCAEQQNAAGYCTNKQCSRHGRRNDYLAALAATPEEK